MKLSIITVNLNNLEGLKRTYDSIVCQTFTDYEWIVIDGGSTDGSREFIEEHQDKISYWCSEPDKGIYNAMNKGIIHAQGEYLNFMNSGDCLACEETLARVLVPKHTEDIIYGVTVNNHRNGSVIRNPKKEQIHWYELYPIAIHHQSAFMRKELFQKVGLYDEELKIASDARWFAMAILHHKATYKYIPVKIAIFEGGGISASAVSSEERTKQKRNICPDYITEEDSMNLYLMSIIQSIKLTSFLFKVIKVLALRIDAYKTKKSVS